VTARIDADAPIARSPSARLVDAIERNALVIVVLTACAGFMASNLRATVGPDTWYSLVSGRLIWRSGLPHHDTLTSLTIGRTWIDQEWLGHLGIYGFFAAGGWPLALLAGAAGYLGSLAISAVGARMRGASDRSTALLAAAAFSAGASNTQLRAQTFAYILFALTLALLLSDERAPSKRVYFVLPLLVLWANIHGSVVLGAAVVALYGASVFLRTSRRRSSSSRRLAAAITLIVGPWVCVLVSPYRLDLLGYYRRVLGNSNLQSASSEWAASTITHQPVFFGVLLISVVIVVVAAARGGLPSPFQLLVLFLLGVFGLVAVRNIVWFALASAAITPTLLDGAWRAGDAPRRRHLNAVLGFAGVAFAIGMFAWAATRASGWMEQSYPPRLAAAVSASAKRDKSSLIFADEQYADWLLYEDPALTGRIAYDVRFELINGPELDRIVAFRREVGADWQTTVRPFGLLVLSGSGDAGAVKWFKAQPNTRLVSDIAGTVILRKGT
jgi:hypothetical protein